MGSLLAGARELLARAWRVRRRLGGGMRQSGILAAAGIYALDHHRDRLAKDHLRARILADGAGEIPGVRVGVPDTNIVMLDFPDETVSLDGVLSSLADDGVLMARFGPRRLRAVTHLGVDDAGIERALEALTQAMRAYS